MRYIDIISGIRTHVSNEEYEMVERLKKGDLTKASLDEREIEVVRNLIHKDIVKAFKNDGKITYRYIRPITKRN